MKKNYLKHAFLTILTGVSLQANSQLIFNEDFINGTSTPFADGMPASWKTYNVDSKTVNSATLLPYFGGNTNAVNAFSTSAWIGFGGFALSSSAYSPAGSANDWLVTPQITLPNAQAGEILQLEFATSTPMQVFDSLLIYVSTTGFAVSDFVDAPVYRGIMDRVKDANNQLIVKTVNLTSKAGQSVYLAFRNNSTDKGAGGMDYVRIRKIMTNDLSFDDVYLDRYGVKGTNHQISYSVTNKGANTITSVKLNWNDGEDHIADVPVSIASGETKTITHPTNVVYPDLVKKQIVTSLVGVNGVSDNNAANNATVTLSYVTTSESVKRIVVLEEGTGTWCKGCPRGTVRISEIEQTNPTDFEPIAVHIGGGAPEPMKIAEYETKSNLASYGLPSGSMSRFFKGIDTEVFKKYYDREKNVVSPVSVTATASVSNSTELSFNTSVQFKTNYTGTKDVRIAAVITENDVRGTGAQYNQVNFYSGQSVSMTDPITGINYATEPDPVPASKMVYNHVARALVGGYDGVSGSLPTTIVDGTSAQYTLNYALPATLKLENCHAVVMVIDFNTKEILNAASVDLSKLGVAENTASSSFSIYPNPVTNAKLTIDLDQTIGNVNHYAITNMAGQVMLQNEINASMNSKVEVNVEGLAKGIYMVTVAGEKASYTKQIVIQ